MSTTETPVNEMKTRTEIDIQPYLPAVEDYAFAIQISDYPRSAGIARIVLLQDYSIMHSQKRIILNAKLLHIDTIAQEDVSHMHNSDIKDWVVTDQFFVMLRDDNGNMQLNPEFIPLEDRVEGTMYTQKQTQKYLLATAFKYFSTAFKYHTGSNQAFFGSIILLGDEINGLFDEYKSLTSKLMAMPPEVNLNPDMMEIIEKNAIDNTLAAKGGTTVKKGI